MGEPGDQLQPTTATYNVQVKGSPPSGLMPFVLYVHTVEITYSINVIVSVMGIIFNLVSVRVFLGMGGVFKDGVSLTFFVLSVSDLGVCVFSLCWSVSATCSFIERRVNNFFHPASPFWRLQNPYKQLFYYPVDPSMIAIGSYIMQSVFSLTTTMITIYLAVMRCLCVARPLKFRGAASPGKSALAFATFLSFALAIKVPTLALSKIKMRFDPFVNVSRPGMWAHPARELVKDVTWTAADIPIPIAAEITLTVCVTIMARALKKSNQFRNKFVSGNETTKDSSFGSGQRGNGGIHSKANEDRTQDSVPTSDDIRAGKLSTKDTRIIKQLVIISLIFIFCNIPKLIRIVVDTAEPEFSISGRYRYTYGVVFTVQVIFEILNSSLNLFIYYSFNTKFRQEFNNLYIKQNSIEGRRQKARKRTKLFNSSF